MALVPRWVRGYQRPWIARDVVAGLIIWSVVTPQAVAYAQIAGLPPQAGLIAAPGAMLGYALLGSSRTLVVSATTATSGVSAVAVGPLADGDMGRFAALSAALALVTAVVLVIAGMLKLGAITDFVSKPVITGFLFGLGLFITVGQLPALLGVEGGGDGFFEKIWEVLEELGSAHGATAAVGLASVALLFAFKRFAPGVPGTIVVLVLAIVVSALLDLDAHGVDVVGALPDALPDPAVPDVSLHDLGELLPSAFGIMILTTEAVGVARALATKDGYAIDVNRELYAMGVGNALSGFTSGFVQSGGASQTAAAEEAGGKSQLASVLAAVLIILTGAFLSPLFEPLPEATLAAIVIVAVTGFYNVGELRRFAMIRRSAIVLAVLALAGVLVLGVLEGLIVTAGLSLMLLIYRLSRPAVSSLARDPASGAWGRAERHPDWRAPAGALVVRVDGPLFYANASSVKERVLELVAQQEPRAVVLELDQGDLDLETLDMLGELADALRAESVALRLASVRLSARELLERAGLMDKVHVEPTLDAAIEGSTR